MENNTIARKTFEIKKDTKRISSINRTIRFFQQNCKPVYCLCFRKSRRITKRLLIYHLFVSGEGGKMKENLPRFTLRVNQIFLDKLGYIAESEGRTKNKELEQMIKKRIADYEKIHGEIKMKP